MNDQQNFCRGHPGSWFVLDDLRSFLQDPLSVRRDPPRPLGGLSSTASLSSEDELAAC